MAEHPNDHLPLIRQTAINHACNELAVFDVREGPGSFKLVAHIRGGDPVSEAVSRAAVEAFADVITPCVAKSRDGAIQVEEVEPGQSALYCLVTLAERSAKVVWAACYIVRCRAQADATNMLYRIRGETQPFWSGSPGT